MPSEFFEPMICFYKLKHVLGTFVLGVASLTPVLAQSGGKGTVRGKVQNGITNAPVGDVRVQLLDGSVFSVSGTDGTFTLSGVGIGAQKIVVSGFDILNDTVSLDVSAAMTDMFVIRVMPVDTSAIQGADLPTIAIEENAGQDEDNSSAVSGSSAGFYVANQDPFLNAAAFTFGPYRFRPRGYDNTDVQVNGVPLQDLETGFAPISLIGGLNDVFRDRNIIYGLRPSEFSFGSTRGSTYISATAADQRKGASISYYAANRTYRNRVMATYNSGVNAKGWAYSFSGSRRWANEGYVPGSFYDAYSIYGAVSKVAKKGQFNLTAFAAPTKRTRVSAEIDQTFDITDDHYFNGGWGYQQGKKRNALINNSFQPIVIANYTYKPSNRTRWNTALGYEFGQYRRSNLEFYNGYSANPTYYRNLPYYYLYGVQNPNPQAAAALEAAYRANPGLLQIQWDDLYNDNYSNTQTVNDVNGIAGNNVTGARSIIVQRDEVDDIRKWSFNTNFTHILSDKLTLNGGLQSIYQQDEYYKELTDLLGGDFFLNFNQFAAQANVGNPTYVQNDLNNPNRIIKEGDKYGYDYYLRALQTTAWGQVSYSYTHFDLFAGVEGGFNSFTREGLMRNGLFPDNSYGKSDAQRFSTVKVKGGVTYKIDARNALFVNAAYFTSAPGINNTYISARTRDFVINNAKTYLTQSVEAGYNLRTSGFNMRVVGYVTDVTGNTLVKRFFNDDPDIQSFVNYVMQNVNTRSLGTEISATAKILNNLSAVAVAAVGQSFYTNRPDVSIYQDNIPSMVPTTREVYIKNYYLGVGPQSVYTVGLRYNPRRWYTRLNFNYMDRNYVEVNPDRRTQLAADKVDPASQKWRDIYAQEKLPSAFTVDLSVGKSFSVNRYYKSLSRRTTLNFNAGIYNLLNNQDIKLSGYEQLRYDFKNQSPYKFPNRYAYAYGRNFYVSVALRF